MAEESKTEYRTAMEAGMVIANAAAGKGDGSYVFVPAGTVVADLEKYLPAPRRIKATATFDNVTSFVEYVNRFKQASTTIFSTPKQAMFGAVLDYHQAPDAPAWGSHIAQLKLQTTEEWDAWRTKNRVQMDQADFAEFMEEHCREITDPPAATMLEIALTFEAKKDVDFKSGMHLDNGQVSFVYNEEVKGTTRGGTVEVPQKFTIFLSVFEGQAQQFVDARLRYRLRDAKLVLWYDLVRPDKLIESAVDDVTLLIKSGTEIEPLVGSVVLGGAASQNGGQR